MSALLEAILKLLTTETGSLTYHLVLAFSLAGAFQLVLSGGSRLVAIRLRRTLIGLGSLLALQLILFAASGLAWQGALIGSDMLPLIDRGVSLLSLILIAWLWCFPDASPAADAGSIILGVLSVVALLFSSLSSTDPIVTVSFNGSLPDLVAQSISLGIILLAVIYLLARHPEGYGYGLVVLITLAGGAALHLMMLPDGVDYPASLRLAQMVAFPFLLLLAQRPSLQPQPATTVEAADRAAISTLPTMDAEFWSLIQQLVADTDPDKVSKQITALMAHSLKADLCLLLRQQNSEGKVVVAAGYDANAQKALEPAVLKGNSAPLLAAALRMGRLRRFAAASAPTDLAALAEIYNFPEAGSMLLAPVLSPDGQPSAGLLLLSPISGRDWNPEEQAYASTLARALVQFLQHSREMNELKEELVRVRNLSRQTQEQLQQVGEERQRLRDQVVVQQENAQRDHLQLASLASSAAAYDEAQRLIQQLQDELTELKITGTRTSERANDQLRSREGDLRLALEEIAELRQSLAETDQKIIDLKTRSADVVPSDHQIQSILAVAQEMRQPLASITDQVQKLLVQVEDNISIAQRRKLDRIKISTGRILAMLDDLVQLTTPESNLERLTFTDLDVVDVVREVVKGESRNLREKHITMKMDLPGKPITIQSDPRAVRQVIEQLLENARRATPQGGSIQVFAQLETSDSDSDYVLLRVVDSGGGIPRGELFRVFSPRPAGETITGLSDPAGQLPRLKTLVELLGGRTWVDSETGHGAIFSILLPVTAEPARSGAGKNGNGSEQ